MNQIAALRRSYASLSVLIGAIRRLGSMPKRTALAILVLWTAAALIGGYLVLRRRDA